MITTTECQQEKCDFNSVPKSNIALLTASTCHHCTNMKEIVAKQIANGSIQVIDENHPRFDNLIVRNDVMGVPTFFQGEQICDFTGTETDPKLTCDGKEVHL